MIRRIWTADFHDFFPGKQISMKFWIFAIFLDFSITLHEHFFPGFSTTVGTLIFVLVTKKKLLLIMAQIFDTAQH